MKKKLFVVVCVSGTEWLVRASTQEEAEADWPADAEEIRHVRPLAGDRATAAWLRSVGQADLDA